MGFPGGISSKEPSCQCRRCKRHGFNPWVEKILKNPMDRGAWRATVHRVTQVTCCYAGQGETLKAKHETTDWFKIGKGVCQGCLLSLCLFNSYAEYIMRNSGLDDPQAGIKIAGRNTNNLRYADDTTLMAESKEPLDESERGE